MRCNLLLICLLYLGLLYMSLPMRTAIVGAGAAGLILSKTLLDHGIQPVIFEKSFSVGGVWKYEKQECRENITLSPMYDSLVTNLPIHLMEINSNFPFNETSEFSYIRHEDVLNYLQNYAENEKLLPYINFGVVVNSISKENGSNLWTLESTTKSNEVNVDFFDNIIVCNGHYTVPFIPYIEGMQNFRGLVVSAMNYDSHDIHVKYTGKNVLVIGARSSATDIAREIASVAEKVVVSDRNNNFGSRTYGNIVHSTAVARFRAENNSFIFTNGISQSDIDVVMFCTGYLYDFPFLAKEILNIDSGRAVTNLYEHMFYNEDTSLSFVGLPWSVTPFYMFHLQAQYIAAIIQRRAVLPSYNDRVQWTMNRVNQFKEISQFPDKYHYLGDDQWEYFRFLIREIHSGYVNTEEELYINTNRAIYDDNKNNFASYPGGKDSYRQRRYLVDRKTGVWTVTNRKDTA